MRNPLQEQLLKAGLVKKDKVAKVVREQAKQRQGKAHAAPAEERVDMVEPDGKIHVTCEYCSRDYLVEPQTVDAGE